MATMTTTLSSFDRAQFLALRNGRSSADDFLPHSHHGLFFLQSGGLPTRPTHYFDDADVWALKRQYDNLNLLEQSRLSNSAEDLSQMENRMNYPFDLFEGNHDDLEEDDVPYDDTLGYDYALVIQERLKRANEEFHGDQTPTELRHSQRVVFDPVVKAVDIVQDPDEHDPSVELFNQASMSTLIEESATNRTVSNPEEEISAHQYTVPLNDTQPRQGPSLLEQIKAMQFNDPAAVADSWLDNSTHTDDSHSNSRVHDPDASNLTTSFTSTDQPMVVAVNGKFDLQHPQDYIAKDKPLFVPAPPSEPKKGPTPPRRPFASTRPKSSDNAKRSHPANTVSLSTPNKTSQKPRPKSAGASSTTTGISVEKPSSGVDFNELLRKAAEKKRAEMREERRKREEAEEKRKQELLRAQEAYQRWVQDKNAERKRIDEEKRLEREEREARQANEQQRLEKLREERYRQWLERKNYQAMLEKEFQKLRAVEEETASDGSSISSKNSQRAANQRAFHRWLRQKYRQALEEKRRERAERKRSRRSIKRHQLHQHLQLAKSYGYS